jgi:hypothetical protein
MKTRIVLRRESYANGPGTKVLLNRHLSAFTGVSTLDGNSIRVSSVNVVDGKNVLETHLLRVNEANTVPLVYLRSLWDYKSKHEVA